MVLRVILQIIPHGDETKTREIGRLDIFNKGKIGLANEYFRREKIGSSITQHHGKPRRRFIESERTHV